MYVRSVELFVCTFPGTFVSHLSGNKSLEAILGEAVMILKRFLPCYDINLAFLGSTKQDVSDHGDLNLYVCNS